MQMQTGRLMPIQAQVLSVGDASIRSQARHQLRLTVQAGRPPALVHKVSETGLLIETSDELEFGEVI